MRTRFAPSPTGPPHLGSLHTALFAFLAVKNAGGQFIIRIDDTDRARSRPEWESEILDALRWIGISWDEGPDVGGRFEVYRQSERMVLYNEAIEKLKNDGFLYPCFCSEQDLNLQRATARAAGRPFIYDGRCTLLDDEEIGAKNREGEKCVWRFRVASHRLGEVVRFNDLVFGDQIFQTELIGDFVAIRADGLPTYMFTSPIDDATMGITHIIRGSDHLPNTPAQILLMKALGYDPPEFAHLPLITGPGEKKLSKRDSMTGLTEIRQHVPNALANHLALLGWTHPEGKEILTRDELIASFSLDRISTSSAAHDPARLSHLEREHILRMSPDEIISTWEKSSYGPAGKISDDKRASALKILGVVKDEITSLKSVGEEVISLTIPPADEVLENSYAGIDIDKSATVLGTVLGMCGTNRMMAIDGIAAGMGKKQVYMPLRIALTGRRHGFELSKLLDAFTHEEVDRRLKRAIDVLTRA